MKVNIEEQEEKFEPVTLRITFESQSELEAMYCHFSHRDTCSFLRDKGVDTKSITKKLSLLGEQYLTCWEEYCKVVDPQNEPS